MAKEVTSIYVGVRASTAKFSQDMKKVQSDAAVSFSKISAVAAAAMTAAAAAVGTALYKIGEEFDKATQKIAYGTGATGAALADLKNSFKEAFSTGINSSADVASAMANLNTLLGLSGDSLTDVYKNVAAAAEIGGVSVAEFSTQFGRLQNLYKIDTVEGYNKSLAKLVAVSQQSGASFSEIMNIFDRYGATIKSTGLEFNDFVNLIGTASAAGIKLNRLMPALGQGARKAATDFQELGSVGDVFNKWLDSISKLKTESEKIDFASSVFGSEGGLAIVELVNQGVTSLDTLKGKFPELNQSITSFVEQNRTGGDKLTQTWNQFKTALAPVGEALVNLVVQSSPYIEQLINWMAETLPGALQAVTEYLPTFADGLTGAIEMAKAAWETFGPAIKGVLNFIIDVEAAAITFAMSWQESIKSVNNMLESMKNLIDSIISAVKNLVSSFGSAVSAAFGLQAASGGGGGSLAGFATGGSFTVGGHAAGPSSGPTDSQLVAFMATPGEQVTVSTPGQQRAAAQAGVEKQQPISQTINISTGVQETVRAEMLALMPRLQSSLINDVNNSIRRNTNLTGNVRRSI